LLTREELTAERIEQIVQDARKAGYDFFLSAEERAASLEQALTHYAAGEEAWVFAYGSLMWNPALEYAESSTCQVENAVRRPKPSNHSSCSGSIRRPPNAPSRRTTTSSISPPSKG